MTEITSSEKHRLTTRWAANGFNVVTDEDGDGDGRWHVAATTSRRVAAHLVELHNRTFGDGQDAPGPAPFKPPFLRDLSESVAQAHQRLMDREENERLDREIDRANRDGGVNAKRDYLPDDLRLSRRYGPALGPGPAAFAFEVDIRAAVERLLYELVSRRVAEHLSLHTPPRIEVDVKSSPKLLAQVLESQGYRVFGPNTALTRDQVLQDSDLLRATLRGRGYLVVAEGGDLDPAIRRLEAAGYQVAHQAVPE